MTNSLSGITHSNGNTINLSGKNYHYNYNHGSKHTLINIKVKNIKDKIIQNYLIPLFSKQWTVLEENIFLIDEIVNKINYYYDLYKINELLVYIELLKVLKILIDNYKLLESYNGTSNGKRDKNEVMSMVFKTSMIRLLPEYEIYDSILGKPKRDFGESYDIKIINHIKNLLTQDDVTYHKIKGGVVSMSQQNVEII
jgi:hypothetical protein